MNRSYKLSTGGLRLTGRSLWAKPSFTWSSVWIRTVLQPRSCLPKWIDLHLHETNQPKPYLSLTNASLAVNHFWDDTSKTNYPTQSLLLWPSVREVSNHDKKSKVAWGSDACGGSLCDHRGWGDLLQGTPNWKVNNSAITPSNEDKIPGLDSALGLKEGQSAVSESMPKAIATISRRISHWSSSVELHSSHCHKLIRLLWVLPKTQDIPLHQVVLAGSISGWDTGSVLDYWIGWKWGCIFTEGWFERLITIGLLECILTVVMVHKISNYCNVVTQLFGEGKHFALPKSNSLSQSVVTPCPHPFKKWANRFPS